MLTWVPTFDNFTLSGQASPVRCTVAFYGPFPTEAAAQQEWQGPLSPTVPPWPPTVVPAFAPPTLLTDDWTSQPQTMAVTLPPTMAPGYYVVLDFEMYVGGQSGSGQVVSVTAS